MSDLYCPDWPLVRISDFAEINIGGTPARATPQFWATKPEGSPWIAISDLKGKYVDDTKEYITDLGARCSNVKLIEPFTTVMSFKLTVGRTAITTRPMYCNEAIAIFSPKSDALNGGWLYHVLPRAAQSVVTDNAVKGATLNKAKMAEITVQLPPIAEQHKIAQILDTLDTAIRETEALIDKLKAVKQGLLQDLLTRGIDANGQLRPPQSEAPQLYKESLLGWIPREWECTALAKRLARITYGFTSPMPTTDEGPWMLTATDVSESRILYEQARHTTERAFRLLSAKSRPNVGDVLVTKDGTLGRVAVLDRDDVCVNQSVAVLSPKNGADSSYLATYLQSPVGQERMLADSGGSTIKHLYISKLAEMSIPWPEEHETEAIVSRISGMTARLENEESLLSKLNRQKSGLMDDLLTGRVRVTPLLESVQQPAAQTGA